MFSIIVCSHRPAQAQRIERHYAQLFAGVAHEIILLSDASSLCEGYARGLRQSRGERLVFSHDDVEFVTPDLATRLERHLTAFDMVGVAGTTRLIDGAWVTAGDPFCHGLVVYPEAPDARCAMKLWGAGGLCVDGAQALDGCFLACNRDVAEAVGFDAATFDGFHLYDLDFTFRAYRRGFRLAVCRDLPLIHASTGTPDAAWERYKERFEHKFAGQLAVGAPGPVRELRATVPRDELARFCAPDHVTALLDRLGQGARRT